MKAIVNSVAFAVLFGVAASPCFALSVTENVSTKRAKELGMEVRSQAAGPNHVSVELEFKTEGKLKDFSGVELQIGQGDNLRVSAALREDRSKAGRVVVGFTADRVQLDQSNLRVTAPHSDGRIIYVLRVKDFVELKKDR